MQIPSLEEMLQAGMHFGHRVSRWHPKMQTYIFGERQGVHIIDLEQAREKLAAAAEFVKNSVASGKDVLFVGTKKQAQEIIRAEAKRASQPYLVERWIGGLLTNFDEIGKLLERYRQMQSERATNAWDKYTKQERARLEDDFQKKDSVLCGIGLLKRPPEAMFIIDIRQEKTAVQEAMRTGITTLALVDTNVNPDHITFPIPGNDDAVKAIALVMKVMADAAVEGMKMRVDNESKAAAVVESKKAAPLIIASA